MDAIGLACFQLLFSWSQEYYVDLNIILHSGTLMFRTVIWEEDLFSCRLLLWVLFWMQWPRVALREPTIVAFGRQQREHFSSLGICPCWDKNCATPWQAFRIRRKTASEASPSCARHTRSLFSWSLAGNLWTEAYLISHPAAPSFPALSRTDV